MKGSVKRALLIVGIFFLPLFYVSAVDTATNSLSVKYLDNFPGSSNFDSRYRNVDKYLVYKYVQFTFEKPIVIDSMMLNFIVDNNWYEKNNIKDIVFLKFDNGEWKRIDYDNKSLESNYKKYSVTGNSVGEYWAIVGVLSGKNNYIGNIKTTKKNNNTTTSFKKIKDVKVVDNVVEFSNDIVLTLKEPVNVKGASAITTATATISLAVLLVLLGGPINLFIIIYQLGVAILGLFFSKKKHRSGIVYDANTGMPVSLARVNLIDKSDNRVKVTRFTDKNGRYYFLAPKGSYYLEARKKGYVIIEKTQKHLFRAILHKSDLESNITLDKSGVVKKNIAVLQDSNSAASGRIKTMLKVLLKYFVAGLFFAGLMVSIWSCYINPVLFNFIILGVYGLILIFRGFFMKKEKYGTVVSGNGSPEAFATVEILDIQTKKIISRVITDTKGRYYILLEKGKYLLNIQTTKGINVSRKININNQGVLAQKIVVDILHGI